MKNNDLQKSYLKQQVKHYFSSEDFKLHVLPALIFYYPIFYIDKPPSYF